MRHSMFLSLESRRKLALARGPPCSMAAVAAVVRLRHLRCLPSRQLAPVSQYLPCKIDLAIQKTMHTAQTIDAVLCLLYPPRQRLFAAYIPVVRCCCSLRAHRASWGAFVTSATCSRWRGTRCVPSVESACICTLRLGEKGGQDVCHKLVSSCSAYARGTVAPTEKSGQVQQVSWICGCVASSSYCGASQHHARRVGKERKLSTHKLCGIASELAS